MDNGIRLRISTGFDPSGVREASAALEKMASDLEKSNKSLLQCNAELSAAMKKYAANIAVDMSAAADKAAKGMGRTYKTLGDFLGDVRAETQEASQRLNELRAKIRAASKAAADARASAAAARAARGMRGIGEEAEKSVKGVNKLAGAINILAQGTGFLGKAVRGVFTGGIWETGAAAARFAIGKITEAWEEHKRKLEEQQKSIADTIAGLANSIGEYKVAVAEAANADREAALAGLNARKNEISLTERLTKATIELNRQKRIAAGEDAATVNVESDSQLSAATAKTARANSDAEIEAIERRIEIAEKEQEAAFAEAERLRESKAHLAEVYEFDTPEQRAEQRRLRRAMTGKIDEARGIGYKAQDRIDKEKAALEAALKSRDALEKEIEANDLKAANEKKAREEEQAAKEKAAAEKAAEERKAAEIAAAKAAAQERERLDRELHQKRMDDLREEIEAQSKAQAGQSAIRSAAQTEFERAFAMYRDPSRAASEIAEERDRANDLDSLHRDARRYGGKWRIDELASLMSAGDSQGVSDRLAEWRKSSKFSPEVEAMVRASAAEKTRDLAEERMQQIADTVREMSELQKEASGQAAQTAQSARDTAENTRDLAAKIDTLLKVKG